MTLDIFLPLNLLMLVLASGLGMGLWVLRGFRFAMANSSLDQFLFGLAIGIGVLEYGIMTIALFALIQKWILYWWLVIFSVAGLFALKNISRNSVYLKDGWDKLKTKSDLQKVIIFLIGIILLAGLFNSLTPVWDQDGLMYHLPGAKAFFDAGRFVLLPEIWQANGPFAVEMLNLLGLAIGIPILSKLINFSFMFILILATYHFGKRYLGEFRGYLAALILLGTPMVPMIGSLAYADIGWTLYSFLGICAILRWQEENRRGWLIVAGLMSGLALGIKYLAWEQLLALALWVTIVSARQSWKQAVSNSASLGAIALLVGSPWYIKNLLLSGNPIYPFVFGGEKWGVIRLASLSAFLNSFGSGKSLSDFFLFPWNIFVNIDRFATSPFDLPSFLFLLAPFSLWMKRSRAISALGFISLVGFVIWWLGSQQSRFLLPLFPGLSLITAFVLVDLWKQFNFGALKRITVRVIFFSLVIVQIIYMLSFLIFVGWFVRPLPVILGLESKDSFLSRMVVNYRALRYVQTHYPGGTEVALFWDGSGYYCEKCNLATSGQWTYVPESGFEKTEYTNVLHQTNTALVLYNQRDRAFFLSHDPTLENRSIADFMEKEYLPVCGREVYRDEIASLYEIICD
jgi:hypothetical protein